VVVPGRLGCALVALVVAGCGSASHDPSRGSATPRPTPAPAAHGPVAVAACTDAGAGWRSLDAGAAAQPATLGTGAYGVVFMNESGDNACQWMTFARTLSRRGFRAAVFSYGSGAGSPGRQVLAIARALRRTGARHVVAIGASVGGRVAVQVAAQRAARRWLDATVSLSGERSVATLPDILPSARRVRIPILYVGARDDGYVSFGRETRQLYRATPERGKAILLLANGGHGVDLLAAPAGARVRPAIIAFARRSARA